MWIRSQDKKQLVCCLAFSISNNCIFGHDGDGIYCLGEYVTEQIAIEVLDVIMQKLDFRYTGVYYMPKE